MRYHEAKATWQHSTIGLDLRQVRRHVRCIHQQQLLMQLLLGVAAVCWDRQRIEDRPKFHTGGVQRVQCQLHARLELQGAYSSAFRSLRKRVQGAAFGKLLAINKALNNVLKWCA